MQRIMLVFAILPFAVFAQKPTKPATAKLKSFVVHYEHDAVLKYDNVNTGEKTRTKTTITMPGKGELNFGKDTGLTQAQMAINTSNAKIVPDWETGYMTADMVTISCTNFPDLKADKFVYNQEKNMALLSGQVSIIDHGTTKFIGNKVYLDFTNDEYKIVSIQ